MTVVGAVFFLFLINLFIKPVILLNRQCWWLVGQTPYKHTGLGLNLLCHLFCLSQSFKVSVSEDKKCKTQLKKHKKNDEVSKNNWNFKGLFKLRHVTFKAYTSFISLFSCLRDNTLCYWSVSEDKEVHQTSLQVPSGWSQPLPPTLHSSTAATGCVWLFRQGQLIVIIYEIWSRSITADWKSLAVCTEWNWVCRVNSGSSVPHLLAICFDQLTKTLCVYVYLCKSSSLNRLLWNRTRSL